MEEVDVGLGEVNRYDILGVILDGGDEQKENHA